MHEKVEKVVNDYRFNTVMILCIVAYASLKFAFRPAADIFQTIFLIGFALSIWVDKNTLTKSNIFKIFLLSLVFPLLSWVNAKINIPELANPTPSLSDSVNLFYFIPIAYLLKRNRKHIWLVWIAFSCGLLLSIIHYSPNLVGQIQTAISGARVDFGFYNLQHASAWAGACIIILSGISLKCISNKNALGSAIIFLSSLPFWFIFMATQTRQTFLGLFLALIFTSSYYVFKSNIKKSYILVLFIIFFVIAALAFNNSGVKNRTLNEANTYTEILSGDFDNFKNTKDSAGIRFALWYIGYQWIKEHPLFGGDRDISKHLIETSPYTPTTSKRRDHTHLHNYYMEIAVSYGLVGLSVILSLFVCIYLNLFQYRDTNGFDEIQFVGLVFIPYWLIVNIFEPQLLSNPGQLIHNVMIGTFFFFALQKPESSQEVKG